MAVKTFLKKQYLHKKKVPIKLSGTSLIFTDSKTKFENIGNVSDMKTKYIIDAIVHKIKKNLLDFPAELRFDGRHVVEECDTDKISEDLITNLLSESLGLCRRTSQKVLSTNGGVRIPIVFVLVYSCFCFEKKK